MSSRLLLIAFKPQEALQGSGFAAGLGLPFDVLSLNGGVPNDLGAERILQAQELDLPPADALAREIAKLAGGYSHIASVSTMRAKDVLARVAGILDLAMITDAISIESPTTFKRPIVAGSLIATVEVLSTPVALTFRPAGFPMPPRNGKSEIQNVTIDPSSAAKPISTSVHSSARPDLSQAKVIVSGGRPLRDAATFEAVIGGLADVLGGAVGATRAAVDSGIATNEMQVGQTGKIVAPDLYIAAGISGSTQHMAGIKDSRIIVAINKDPDAPIFEAADYGLVADLFDAVPELTRTLQ